MQFFITGTDTGVGKTYVSCLLLKSLTAAGQRAAGFKPICCGPRDDAVELLAAGDSRLQLEQVNPCWLQTPASPYAASLIEDRSIDLARIYEIFDFLKRRYEHIIAEGIGGWEVPIARGFTLADLAAELRLPVVVVIHNRLGALNHAILTLKNIQHRGVRCAGLILNHPDAENARERDSAATATNKRVLEDVAGAPVLQEIEYGAKAIDLAAFAW